MSILKKFFSFSIGTWVGAVISVITIPLLTNFFAPDEFAKASLFALALNIMMLFTLFGVDQAFIRFYYEEETKKLLSKCLIISLLVYVISIFLLFVFRVEVSMFLFNAYVPEMIVLLSLATFISIVNFYSQAILRMEQKGFLFSAVQVILRLFEIIFILMFLLLLKNDYSIMVYGKVMTLFVVLLFSIFFTRKTWQGLKFNFTDSNYSIKDILKYSYPLAFTTIIGWGMQSVDKIALKQWATLGELGIYTAAFKIAIVLQIVQTSFTTYWIPLSYERFLKHKNDDENKIFFGKVNAVVTLIMFLCCILLIMCKDLILYLIGPNYRQAIYMIPFLVIMPVMYTISESTTIGLNFYKKVNVILLITISTMLINIVGNIILVPLLKGIGASLTIAISSIVFFILRTHFSLKYYKVNFHLWKMYPILFLIIGYACYSTFFKWDIINLIIGFILILITIIIYFKDIDKLYKQLKFI